MRSGGDTERSQTPSRGARLRWWRRRKASPWARIALREPHLFRWWSFCRAPAAPLAESPVYEHIVLIALLLPVAGWLLAWVEPTFGLVLAGGSVLIALWIPFAGRRMRRIRRHCLEHVRRRHARRHPQSPEWGWALMRAQERSITFNATPVTDPLCTAAAVVGVAIILTSFNPLVQAALGASDWEKELWLRKGARAADAPGRWALIPLAVGLAVLVGSLAVGILRAERDRRRLRRPMLEARCLRCGYRIMETALRRDRLRCGVCPECAYRYPLHPPPTSGRLGGGLPPMWGGR